MNKRIPLFKNSFWGGVAAIFRMLSSVVTVFLLIHSIGAPAFGVVAIISTTTSIWIIINSGFYTVLVRKLVHAYDSNDNANVSHFINAGRLYTLMSMLIAFIIYALFREKLAVTLFDNEAIGISLLDFTYSFDMAILVIILKLAIYYIAAIFEGRGNFSLAAKMQMCSPAAILCLLISTITFGYQLSIISYFTILLISSIAELLLSIILLVKSEVSFGGTKKTTLFHLKLLFSFVGESAYLQTANLFSVFVDPLNKYVLYYFVGPVGVTSYEVVIRILNAMRGVFSASFKSFIQLSPNIGNASKQYKKVMDYIFIPTIIIHFLVLMIVSLVLGMGYWDIPSETIYLLIIVLPTSIAIVAVSPLYSLLIGLGDVKYIVLLHFRLAILNAVGAIIFIPAIGLLGSAIGLACASLYNAYSVYRHITSMHVDIVGFKYFLRGRGSEIATVIFLTLVVIYFSSHLNELTSMIIVISSIALMVLMFIKEPFCNKYLLDKIKRAI